MDPKDTRGNYYLNLPYSKPFRMYSHVTYMAATFVDGRMDYHTLVKSQLTLAIAYHCHNVIQCDWRPVR